MSKNTIRPSTLGGIKSLAGELKGELKVAHVRALDIAAQKAGYQNFRHADNVLRLVPGASEKRPSHYVYLTAYWKDKRAGTSGRETFRLAMACLWSDLVTPAQMEKLRALQHFRAEATDHLARQYLLTSQSEARRAVCAVARELQFMEATRLRPSKSHSRAFPGGRSINAIPGRDHCTVWFEPGTRRYLLVDEPYAARVSEALVARESWSQEYGFKVLQTQWAGMYAPDFGSRMYLVADATKGVPLEPIATALNRLPAPLVADNWQGESAPMLPFFVTPGAQSGVVRDKESKPAVRKPSGPRNTVGYVQTFVGPQRRPNARMPIQQHEEVGRLLMSVLTDSVMRRGVNNRIAAVRCELYEWVQREYNDSELPNKQCSRMYFHEGILNFNKSISEGERARLGANLENAKSILVQHYPDCPPLRSMLKKVAAAQKSLETWA